MELRGILVATVTPFTPTLEMDEHALVRHLRALVATPGLGGLVATGHAGEGSTLTREERRRVVELHAKEIAGRMPLVVCLEAVATAEAIALAAEAKEAGADAVMVCPPPIYAWHAATQPEVALAYHRAIDRAVDIPIVLFQYPPVSPLAYAPETLLEMAHTLDHVVGVKIADGGNIRRYESDYRALRALGKRIAILYTSAREFFQHFLTGADGALTGFGNVAPRLCVALWEAVQHGDVAEARRLHDLMYPVTSLVYCDPHVHMHTRYKEATHLVGRIPCAAVRPPQLPLAEAERAALRTALARTPLA